MFVVRCFVVERCRDSYVLDEPTGDVTADRLYFDLPTAIDGLERKWLRAVHSTIVSHEYAQGVILPETDITLELSLPEVPSLDLESWRESRLGPGGGTTLLPKFLGVDWFQTLNFVASRG
jgi:hypothetical protein